MFLLGGLLGVAGGLLGAFISAIQGFTMALSTQAGRCVVAGTTSSCSAQGSLPSRGVVAGAGFTRSSRA
jgi:hypothetical protein